MDPLNDSTDPNAFLTRAAQEAARASELARLVEDPAASAVLSELGMAVADLGSAVALLLPNGPS
jgi:hypothetical protein